MIETWLPIADYPDYEVSDQGRVRSLDKAIVNSRGQRRTYKGKMLSPVPIGQRRYLGITLSRNGKQRIGMIHILVLEAFVGPRPERAHACHCDDNPANNALVNLHWGSSRENSQEAIANGRNWKLNITHCPQGHGYTEDNTYINPSTGHRACRTCIVSRGKAKNKGNAEKDRTHCPQGHEYSEKNTYRYGNKRLCKTCNRDRAREYQRAKKARG